jgi:hypothetical protein
LDYVALPTSDRGNTKGLVAIDHFTKWVAVFAFPTENAVYTAYTILIKWIAQHGCMESILTDRGTPFLNEVVAELMHILGIHQSATTAFNPQANGLTEKTNSTFISMLRAYCSDNQSSWDVYLPLLVFAHNSATSASTGESPYYLLYGRDPILPIDLLFGTLDVPPFIGMSQYAQDLTARLRAAFDRVSKKQAEARSQYENHPIQSSAKNPLIFAPGDQVLLYKPNSPKGVHPKIWQRWVGPYRVLLSISPHVYQITPVNGRPAPENVHISRLKHYYTKPPSVPDDPQQPPQVPPQPRLLQPPLYPNARLTDDPSTMAYAAFPHIAIGTRPELSEAETALVGKTFRVPGQRGMFKVVSISTDPVTGELIAMYQTNARPTPYARPRTTFNTPLPLLRERIASSV